MDEMLILKCRVQSSYVFAACPVCGRISQQMLKKSYDEAETVHELQPAHTCPICNSVYRFCHIDASPEWAAAFERYNSNWMTYLETVKVNHALSQVSSAPSAAAVSSAPDQHQKNALISGLCSVLEQIARIRAEHAHPQPAEHVQEADPVPFSSSAATPVRTAEPGFMSNSTDVLEHKLDHWKRELLDTSRRNRMINYRDTKRSTLRILEPDPEKLFNHLSFSEKPLSFQKPIGKDSDFRTYAMLSLLETLNYTLPVHVGDIRTDGTIVEREKTLRNLRSKAKLAQEEQGTNILYLSFGFILWREHNRDSSPWMKSPLLLMPVSLGLKSLNAPFTLTHADDETEVNPTLDYLFKTEYGIELPAFDAKNRSSFSTYMDEVEYIVERRGWKLMREVSLGLLSFLKISMYHDLNDHHDLILNSPVLQAISGSADAIGALPVQARNFRFDDVDPMQWHEVVDADSSQQEAILLSKLGQSFVMQGPPGTGKSQTITNIIAQALADNKKVLFVSEKAAALQVVLRRLTEVGLADFCLSLHDYKANKKDILDNIGANLSLSQESANRSMLSDLTELFRDRKHLSTYTTDLHKPIAPLDKSIYEVFGCLGKLKNASEVDFRLDHPETVTADQFLSMIYCVSAFERALHSIKGPLSANPWHTAKVTDAGQTFKAELLAKTGGLDEDLTALDAAIERFNAAYFTNMSFDQRSAGSDANQLLSTLQLPLFPSEWLSPDALAQAHLLADLQNSAAKQYSAHLADVKELFDEAVLNAPLESWQKTLAHAREHIRDVGFARTARLYTDALSDRQIVSDLLAQLRRLADQYRAAARRIGIAGLADTLPNAMLVSSALDVLQQSPGRLLPHWFDSGLNLRAAGQAALAQSHAKALQNALAVVAAQWDPSVYSMDRPALSVHFPADRMWLYPSADIFPDALASITDAAAGLRAQISSLIDAHTQACMLLDLPQEHTPQRIEVTASILKILGGVSCLEAPWLDVRKNASIAAAAQEAEQHAARIAELSALVGRDWDPAVFSIDADAMLARFKTEYSGLFYKLKNAYKTDMRSMRLLYKAVGRPLEESTVAAVLQTLHEIKLEKVWFSKNSSLHAELFGALYRGFNTDWKQLRIGIASAAKIAEYFPYASIPQTTVDAIGHLVASIQGAGEARRYAVELPSGLQSLRSALSAFPLTRDTADLSKAAAQLDTLLSDCAFQTRALPGLKSAFKQSSLSYSDILELSAHLQTVEAEQCWFAENKALHEELFGADCSTFSADWARAKQGLACAARLNELFNGAVPQGVIACACNSGDRAAEELMPAAQLAHTAAELESLLKEKNLSSQSISVDLIPALEAYEEQIRCLSRLVQEMQPYLSAPAALETVYEKLPDVLQLRTLHDRILQDAPTLQATFQERYAGLDTNWENVLADICRLEAFFRTETSVISRDFLLLIANDTAYRAEVAADLLPILHLCEASAQKLDFFASLFHEDILANAAMSELAARHRACMNGFDHLNSWLDYIETKSDCDKIGLSCFTDAIAFADNSIPDVLAAFERGFYAQWLRTAIENVPAVQTFRRRVHDQRLEKFIELDKKQFALSTSRIREKLIGTFPKQDEYAGARSELGILRHEMEKKRRIIPLRQLFRSIPNLLLTLKPCLMMSPLSVAYFLDANAYQFDMVIFDEASQIFPQDAIGAIFRAKQVIIAGDTRQLPPTNFFAASTSNANQDNFDEESEEAYEDESFDSILEETANVLPSRTLLWHYRSKHEHLIAFSNQSIYRNELVTFPSSSESEPDTGVEFVYVEDGYYEGSGRNCNIPEAKRCVELIKDHIDRFPERSLGVIAFSEKQQQAISLEVQRFREQNPQYEAFFAEDKDDEFFIKNLENVQGDERDTIIFSIGYAKTKEQKANGRPMSMRFGPLGMQGGERRLNVAITRAKLNIKLISSILPSDIDLSRTESEGIKMLKNYIEFARNGAVSLPASRKGSRPDDFVDVICEFVTQHGCKARKHIGCSGYKVDLAIEHPDAENFYAVGIECDGLAYASAKTVRDRDRLRRSVLTGMGWNMYRIWSAEWYKNPDLEGQKLLAFIQEKLSECTVRIQSIRDHKARTEEALRSKHEKELAEKARQEKARLLEEERRRVDEQQQRVSRLARSRRQPTLHPAESTPAADLSWVKTGAAVRHQDYGQGTITDMTDDRVTVKFDDGEEKLFALPHCVVQGFLIQDTDLAPSPNPAPAAHPATRSRRTASDLLEELQDAGFTCIDRRPASPLLWVMYEQDKADRFTQIIMQYGGIYALEMNGAPVTQGRPAWRISVK